MNTAKNHLVAQNRRPPTDDVDAGDAEQFDTGTRLRDTDTPEHELLRQEIERTVMRVVEALPEELRTAITLREVDGLSYEEIAQKMDCPIGTVRSRIFRAREAIDAELRPLLDNDICGSCASDDSNLRSTNHRLTHDRETLSALFDGELRGDAARFALKRLGHDAQWRQACGRWQLYGDVLRGQATAVAARRLRRARGVGHRSANHGAQR